MAARVAELLPRLFHGFGAWTGRILHCAYTSIRDILSGKATLRCALRHFLLDTRC
jgi:hypothetical protein